MTALAMIPVRIVADVICDDCVVKAPPGFLAGLVVMTLALLGKPWMAVLAVDAVLIGLGFQRRGREGSRVGHSTRG